MSAPIWVLDIPFDMRLEAAQMGARWDKAAGAAIWVGERLPHSMEPFKALPLSWEWHRQYALNGRHLEKMERLDPPFLARIHQHEAADMIEDARLAKAPGFLLADEVGVGKTLSAWEFAMRAQALKTVLVVTTAGAIAHWRHSILHAGWRADHRIMLINYDRMGKLFEVDELSSSRRKGKRKRIAKEGTAPEFDLVIFDESHKGKTPTSARGLMMRKIGLASQFNIWASATAGQHPVELIYLSALLAKATKSRPPSSDIGEFVDWCVKQGLGVKKGAFGSIVWERSDEDIARVHGWLFGGKIPFGLRRLPQNIAGWPAMERQMMPIDMDARAKMAYAKVWDAFVAEEIRRTSSGHRGAEDVREREKNRMRLRQEASWLRIPSTMGLAKDLLEQGKRVAISVAFRATQEEMGRLWRAAKIEPAMIHGDNSKAENERQRLRFQKGETPVVVFTVEEAISLHQGEYEDVPRIMLLHDVRWSAIQLAQIEGRCHRDGALAPVLWLAAAETVEMDIAASMANRVIGMKAMHGDPTGDLKEIEVIIQQAIARSAKNTSSQNKGR